MKPSLGQVTRAETKDGSNALIVAYDYTYDTAHRLKTVTDSRGNKTLTYTFSPGGWLSRISDSDGHTNTYRYDAVGRLQTIIAPNGESTAYLWDAGGRLKSKWLPNGVQANYVWNADNSLASLENKAGATQISNHAYSYDAHGNRATQAETIAATTKNWSYQYDALNRVTQASDGTATNWTWDIFGNRRSQTIATNTLAYLNDDAHQLNEIRNGTDVGTLLAAFKYDANGNLTKKCDATSGGSVTQTTNDCTASGTGSSTLALAYDALDQLIQANKTGQANLTFAYDDQGRRIKKTGATTTHYLYNGSDIHAEYASPAGAPSAVYAHGPSMDDPIARLTGSTNQPTATASYYHQDGLGSAVATTDSLGAIQASQRFDAWGNRVSGTGTVAQYGYTGREPDESGLVYYRARYYDPQVGRFTQRDPLGSVDGFNSYLYAAANPVLFVDPEGMMISFVSASAGSLLGKYWNSTSEVLADAGAGFSTYLQRSIDGARSESFGDGVNRLIQGSPVGPEVGMAGVAIGAVVGGIKSVRTGQVAETAVREAVDIGDKVAFKVNGNSRIADGLNRVLNTISEIKNTATQAFTSQLRDYVAYSQQQGLKFDLYVRESTVLSGPLKDAINSGLIRFNLIPKSK